MKPIFSTLILTALFFSLTGCGGAGDLTIVNAPTPTPAPPQVTGNLAVKLAATGSNVMPVSVSGTLCSNNKYINEPCVKITICEPGTSTCQTIDNILLDTGSYGLRVFKSVLTGVNLPSVVDTLSRPYATCALFGSGASWGSVHKSDVILGDLSVGGEKAQNVSLQLIDDTFASQASKCNNGEVDHSPADAYFNGILGIGLFVQDCGSRCVTMPNVGMYFSCTGSTCSGSRITLANQVSNPIFSLPVNNNGSILSLPDVNAGGGATTTGNLILGIGTQANNQPDSGLYFLQADPANAYITNTYKGTTLYSLFDSGTNGFAFADTSITNCSSSSAFYCPASTLSLSATQTSSTGFQVNTAFEIANATTLLSNGSNYVYNNIGFELGSTQSFFIYGLPFHLGRSVYMGLEGRSSSLGSNLYWAY